MKQHRKQRLGDATQARFLLQSRAMYNDLRVSVDDFSELKIRPALSTDTSKTPDNSPVEMPLFYGRLAFVALNKVHISTESEIEAIVGPSLCHTLQQTSGLLFCCPISSPIQEGQRRAGIWPSKSHSPSCWTLSAWHRDNEVEGGEATAPRNRSVLRWRRGSKWNRAHTPQGAVRVHDSPRTRPGWALRAPVGQIVGVKQQLLNKSAQNQQADAEQHACNQQFNALNQQHWWWWQCWWNWESDNGCVKVAMLRYSVNINKQWQSTALKCQVEYIYTAHNHTFVSERFTNCIAYDFFCSFYTL